MTMIEVGANLIDWKVGLGVVVDVQAVGSTITPIGQLFNHEIIVKQKPEIVVIVLCVPLDFKYK